MKWNGGKERGATTTSDSEPSASVSEDNSDGAKGSVTEPLTRSYHHRPHLSEASKVGKPKSIEKAWDQGMDKRTSERRCETVRDIEERNSLENPNGADS